MEKSYTEVLKDYLQGKRNVSKQLYRLMSTAYRAVQAGRTTWDDVIKQLGGCNE